MTTKRLCVAFLIVVGILTALAPATSATAITVSSLAGKWEFVGWASVKNNTEDEAVDIVRLDLVDFPAGHLSGSWEETDLRGWQSVALNGTECEGCGGPPGTYWNEFQVTGYATRSFFSITLENNGQSVFQGGLGNPPAAATAYGCFPVLRQHTDARMFLVNGANAYRFFRPNAWSVASVGTQIHPPCW